MSTVGLGAQADLNLRASWAESCHLPAHEMTITVLAHSLFYQCNCFGFQYNPTPSCGTDTQLASKVSLPPTAYSCGWELAPPF